MNDQPDTNGKETESTPPKTDRRNQRINRHLAVIGVIALLWFTLLVIVIIDHAGEIIRVFRLIGLIFIGYLIYATISILRNWNKWNR